MSDFIDESQRIFNDRAAQTETAGPETTFSSIAALLYGYWCALKDILTAHCEGGLLIRSEQVDMTYIDAYEAVQKILGMDGFEELRQSFPSEGEVPKSLHSMDADDAEIWEEYCRPAVDRYTGEILRFCHKHGARDLCLDPSLHEVFKAYHQIANALRRTKKVYLDRLMSRVDKEREGAALESKRTDGAKPATALPAEGEAGKAGNPGLSREELINRLAYALRAEELKTADTTWKEIAREIGWPYGCNQAGVKLLEDARKRLKRLRASDPEGLLAEAEERLRKEKKEIL